MTRLAASGPSPTFTIWWRSHSKAAFTPAMRGGRTRSLATAVRPQASSSLCS